MMLESSLLITAKAIATSEVMNVVYRFQIDEKTTRMIRELQHPLLDSLLVIDI